mgnify:CR=1 FL=1
MSVYASVYYNNENNIYSLIFDNSGATYEEYRTLLNKSFDIQNVLFNVTTKVPHVTQTLPTVKVENVVDIELQNVFEEIFNRNAKKLPVYVHERPKKRPFVQYFLSLAVVYAG